MRDQHLYEHFMNYLGTLTTSNTMIIYKGNLKELTSVFRAYPNAIKYLVGNWLTPYKEKFYEVWTTT